MFIELKLSKPTLKDWFKKASKAFNFDIIKIIGINPVNQKLSYIRVSENKVYEEGEDSFIDHCRRIIDIVGREQKALLINDIINYKNALYDKYDGSNSVELYVPVIKKTENKAIIAGVVFFAWKSAKAIDVSSNQEFNELISELHSILIANYDSVKKRESSYQVAYMLAEIIDMKEPYLISRLYNVAHWCAEIAREMGLSQTDIEKLQIATLMHDLGRIYISEYILNKNGKLTDQEYELIKKRVTYSYEIAQKFDALYEIEGLPEIILNSQERIDGKGYPSGKKGEEIPLLSKILSVTKAVSSMLTNTSYRAAKSIEEAIYELRKNRNTQFDEKVVDSAITILADERKYSEECLTGMGSFAALNLKITKDGAEESLNIWGNIIKNDNKYIFLPTIKLFDYKKFVLQSCNLYINFNDQIIHYIPRISEISEDEISISHMDLDVDNKAITINWLLPALLVTPARNVYNIFVTVIGGNYLDFYIFTKDIHEELAEGVIQLTFDDGNKVVTCPLFSHIQNVRNHLKSSVHIHWASYYSMTYAV